MAAAAAVDFVGVAAEATMDGVSEAFDRKFEDRRGGGEGRETMTSG